MKTIRPEERALIDAAIAAGRVQVIPTGQTSFVLPVWNGQQLVSAEPEKQRAEMIRGMFAQRRQQPSAEQIDRRRAVALLHADGLSVAEMADRLGNDPATLRNDLRALDLVPHRSAPKPRPAIMPHIQMRHDTLRIMAREGHPAESIAAALGFTVATIRSMARMLEQELPPSPPVSKVPAATLARRARVAALIAKGCSLKQIQADMAMSRSALHRDVYSLPPEARPKARIEAERRQADQRSAGAVAERKSA